MDRRLYEASLQGDVSSLLQLIQEDALILDRRVMISNNFTDDAICVNPLHIAAMRGHIDFAKVILEHKPELASKVDSQGFYPLHWASASTNVDMVRELSKAQRSVCLSTDGDGRTPLHVAVVEGRVEVIKELVRCEAKAVEVVLYGGETILHLCVKNGRLEALKVLLEWMKIKRFDHQMVVSVNSKDDDGNTLLHIAVAKRQIQIIELLLGNGVEVNALNKNGFTALDIMLQSPRELKDVQVFDLLQSANALRSSNVLQTTNNTNHVVTIKNTIASPASNRAAKTRRQRPSQDLVPHENNENWLEKKRSTLMVVASLIATMAFQGGVNPPGGVWQDDGSTNGVQYTAGKSVMSNKHPNEYVLYMFFNTVGFITSLSVTLLLISGIPLRKKLLIWTLTLIMWVSLTSMSIAYYLALLVISPSANRSILPFINFVPSLKKVSVISIVKYAILGWVLLLCVILVVHVLRFTVWLLKTLFKKIFICICPSLRKIDRRD
ncbi:hypothetical protein Scep_024902 [Stephania cephalantha]|uniref:PGG domain-containing protein n=1 Tax=Stephania cephalantha TaxID=152367 RepID=A0AAP0HXI8_9MAGN